MQSRFAFSLALFGFASCFRIAMAQQTPGVPARPSQAQAPDFSRPGMTTYADTELTRARALFDRGDLAGAEQLARAFVASHQDSADGHYLLGLILFGKKDARASLSEYTAGARFRKPSAVDLLVVGSDYVLLGAFADADKWFTTAVDWAPTNELAWYYLARTKYNENRFDEAIAAFQKCLTLEPRNVKAEDNLGLSFQAVQRNDDAAQAFQTAIEWEGLHPSDAGPFIDLGALLVQQGRATDSLQYLRRAVEIAPEDARARLQLGKAYVAIGRLPEAQAELERSEQLNPDDAPLHYVLGQLYRREGLQDKAKNQFARYAELSATHSASEPPGTMAPPKTQ